MSYVTRDASSAHIPMRPNFLNLRLKGLNRSLFSSSLALSGHNKVRKLLTRDTCEFLMLPYSGPKSKKGKVLMTNSSPKPMQELVGFVHILPFHISCSISLSGNYPCHKRLVMQLK